MTIDQTINDNPNQALRELVILSNKYNKLVSELTVEYINYCTAGLKPYTALQYIELKYKMNDKDGILRQHTKPI